jgi:hypothetical protein
MVEPDNPGLQLGFHFHLVYKCLFCSFYDLFLVFPVQSAILEYCLVLFLVHRLVVHPQLGKVTDVFPLNPSDFEMAAKRSGKGHFCPWLYFEGSTLSLVLPCMQVLTQQFFKDV